MMIKSALMPQESSAGTEVMDLDAALARVEGDRELLAEMAGLFLKDCDSELEGIRGALGRDDLRAAALGAHALKGSLASLSASEAREVVTQLEARAIGGECSNAREACERLAPALARLRPVLEDVYRSSLAEH